MHLDGDICLLDRERAFLSLAGTIGLVAVEGHADLLLTSAHLGVEILEFASTDSLFSFDRNPLLESYVAAKITGHDLSRCVILDRKVVRAQRALVGQRGIVPINDVFKNLLRHGSGILIVDERDARLKDDGAGLAAVGHLDGDFRRISLVACVAAPGEADGL